jgi:hypothetical protein
MFGGEQIGSFGFDTLLIVKSFLTAIFGHGVFAE